ncbi:MAG TPA: hypothetical protein VMA77_09440 [Solirubrobacteraceae bacterium]|nr:hypothetical protein [Solirubrobacteraceae bacterium]
MTTFTPVSVPQIAPPDPSKHVNYEMGMVLGVDDFVQEFAYSSGRDKQIVRELIGYGVVSGLAVTVETQATGPIVQVAPGELVTPSGQFVCISPAQCANLNDWLAANIAEVQQISSPPPASLQLAVVACYAECLTDNVPIPGEPCRSDDELQQPSRVKDSFSLNLQLTGPQQIEDDAIVDFVRWVRSIPVVDAAPGDLESFIEEIRQAMQLEAASPPSPPTVLAFLYASPPASLQIPRADAGRYLRALFSFWVTDVRALVRSPIPGAECGCSGAPGPLDATADCLSIAELTVPLVTDAITGAVIVADSPPVAVTVDEMTRPTLLHLKLLQQWILSEAATAEGAPPVVAGSFLPDGVTVAATGGLSAEPLPLASPPPDATLFLLTFPRYSSTAEYVVTGQPVASYSDAQASTFEVIPNDDPGLAPDLGSPPPPGIVVRVRQSAGTPVPGGFTVRIEEL